MLRAPHAFEHHGHVAELAADDERVEVHCDGALRYAFPRGWRLATDQAGELRAVIGMSPATVTGELALHRPAAEPGSLRLSVAANERIELDPGGRVTGRSAVSFIPPTTGR